MSRFKDVRVGDTIWFRPGKSHRAEDLREVKVTRVTLASFYVRDYRFDKETGRQTNAGGFPPGETWVSMQAYLHDIQLHATWRKFAQSVAGRWRPPSDLTLDRLEQLQKELL